MAVAKPGTETGARFAPAVLIRGIPHALIAENLRIPMIVPDSIISFQRFSDLFSGLTGLPASRLFVIWEFRGLQTIWLNPDARQSRNEVGSLREG
jgi:hypothetical protein